MKQTVFKETGLPTFAVDRKMKTGIEKKLQEAVNGHAEGFTTMELIMVVIITGIMMAVVLPKMGIVNKIDLYGVAKQVKSDIRYTQEMAMSKYAIRKIVFTESGDTYDIKNSSDQIIESRELPKRSRAIFNAVGSGTTSLIYTFNSSGEPTTGAGGILRISSGGSSENITVENITGRVTIQ